MHIKRYNDGFTFRVPDNKADIDPAYIASAINFAKLKRHFLAGKPITRGVVVEFNGQLYGAGECYPVRKAKAARAAADAKAAKALQAARKAPVSAPTLDMFDNTDPNAPRTTDQNSAFWGLMDRLGKLTGKTGEEMKGVLVFRALGVNKGTSKLTVAEMDMVIRYAKDTIELFEAHDRACRAEGVKA